MLNAALVAEVNAPELATSVYPTPNLSMLRPLNVATPPTAATVAVPESVAPPGLVPMASVTLAELFTRLPTASCICTVIAGAMAAPDVELVGC